jgi:hypothetical protein
MGGGTFRRKFLLSSPAHFVSVIILSGIQISICIIWFFRNPPKPTTSTILSPNFVRYLHCTDHTNLWFLVSSGFLIILSLICTLLAFKSRNFPENYNHAKFISLAMFTFNVVWLTFMGAYYGNSQPGVHQPIFRCCAIIFSNLCLMLLIYGPKVYVIFFRPELNNARTFREMNLQHLLAGVDRGRTFSLASVGAPGHGNVYLMDCDPNEKAVQTTRVLTYNVHTQTDEENYKRRHKSSLVSKLFHRGRGSRRKTGEITSPTHKRGWSESDAPKKHIKIGISHSQSSPILLYAHSKGEERRRTRQVKPLLDDFDGSDEIGLDRIEEVKDNESLAISSTVIRNNGNGTLQDSCDYESTSSHHYYISSNDLEDEDKDDRDNDDDDGSVNAITKDDVFVMDDCTQSAA